MIIIKSLPAIADELKVSINTLRYRIKQHADFIPSEQTSKGVEYNDEAEGIIRTINELCNDKKSTEDITQILASQFVRDIQVVAQQQPTTNLQPTQNAEFARLNNNIERMTELLVRQQEQYNKNMQDQMNDMRVAIGELSRVEKNKAKWYKFW